MMYQWGGGYGNGLAAWAGAFMVILFIAVVIGLVLLVRAFNSKSQKTTNDEAMDILKKRYVNGEIDQKEYEEKRNTLLGK